MKKMIPDCYWPSSANGAYVSHEAICVLNQGDEPAELDITLYFEDREPVEGLHITVPARRVVCHRTDLPFGEEGCRIPFGQYSLELESDIPVCASFGQMNPF